MHCYELAMLSRNCAKPPLCTLYLIEFPDSQGFRQHGVQRS